MVVSIAPELPSYYSGVYNAAIDLSDFSPDILTVLDEYSSKSPITSGITGCTDYCTARVRAPALLAQRCEGKITHHNFSDPDAPDVYMFGTSLTSSYGTTETLDFMTTVAGDEVAETCAGLINTTHCYLQSAIAEYEVVISNGTITLVDPANPTWVAWANNTAITNKTIDAFNLREPPGSNWIRTTLGGIVNAFYFELAILVQVYPPSPATQWPLSIAMSDTWFVYSHIKNYAQYYNNEACLYAWKDPRTSVMARLNELMFRIGVHAANKDPEVLEPLLDKGLDVNYTVTGTLREPRELFKSDFRWFSGAAVLEILAILIVGSTFWRYNRLGREVSFCPLEMAKAS